MKVASVSQHTTEGQMNICFKMSILRSDWSLHLHFTGKIKTSTNL